jgi:hypothetical protein
MTVAHVERHGRRRERSCGRRELDWTRVAWGVALPGPFAVSSMSFGPTVLEG